MRIRWADCLWALLLLAPSGVVAAPRTILMLPVTPERSGGETYVAANSAADLLGARMRWNAKERTTEFSRPGRLVRLRLGDRNATLNGKRVSLRTAPYLREARLMVPFRRIAEALAVEVDFDDATDSITVGPGPDGMVQVVPLPTRKQGIVIYSPEPQEECARQVRVFSQANVPGGITAQLLAADGTVLVEGRGAAVPLGAFREVTTLLLYARSEGEAQPARVVVFGTEPRTGQRLHEVSVPITFRPR